MNARSLARLLARLVPQAILALGLALTVGACNNGVGGTGGTGGGGGGGGSDPLDEALSFDGNISGKVSDNQTTRASLVDTSSAQQVPPDIDTDNTIVTFHDVAGEPLQDENGQPVPSVRLDGNGGFQADGLPVGIDFTMCVDIGEDGTCDVESCIQIPSTDGRDHGQLDGIQADPLTTLVLAKLRRLLEARGIDPADLPFSPAAVVARVVAAYTNLFDEQGIDRAVALEDILALPPRELAAFFDSVIPSNARTGIKMVEGNLGVIGVRDNAALAVGVAEVFLRAGFPIHDLPGGLDLSALGSREEVESIPAREFFSRMGPPMEDFPSDGPPKDDFPSDGPPPMGDFPSDGPPPDDFIGTAQSDPGAPPPGPDGLIYINTVFEPDRNFANAEGGEEIDEKDAIPHLPMLNDFVLMQMARLQLEDRRITLGDLYDLLTSLEDGLGARLTYFVFDPNFAGPPLNVFETADGRGRAINLERLFRRFAEEGFEHLTPEEIEAREDRIRDLLNELLGDTVPPAFERLFKALLRDRLGSVDELARRLREARAHLPFSLSGPSAFFVVADGDPFRSDAPVNAITVDAEVDVDGRVVSVTYNPNGDGAFWLGFSHRTDEDGIVEFIVRETGRFLHGSRGPMRRSILDEEIFQPVNGVAFAEFVAESGTFYPGINIPVVRRDFVPEPMPFDPVMQPIDGTLGSDVNPVEGDPTAPPVEGDGTPDDGTASDDDGTVSDDDGTTDDDGTASDDDGTSDDGTASDDDGTTDDGTASDGDGSVEPAPAEFEFDDFDHGPNQQIFVLATELGRDSEPVRVDYDRATGVATYNPFGRNLLQFMPDSHETGLFGLFNEDTGQQARAEDPADFFAPPPERPEDFDHFFNEVGGFDGFDQFEGTDDIVDHIDGDPNMPPPDGDPNLPPPDGDPNPPPPDGDPADPPPDDQVSDDPIVPAEFAGLEDEFGNILVDVRAVVGLPIEPQEFTHVFGTEVPNQRYDASRDPYYDDVNGDGEHQPDTEPTAQFRPTLFNPADWRSTDIRLYYRRADNNEPVLLEEVAWDSPTPVTLDGAALVPRTYLPRRNAFRFGRPNTAINLLTAFAPRDFFDGTRGLSRDTELDIFSAIAFINLIMDQVFNVEAEIDVDGLGPLPKTKMLIDAHIFMPPIDDPFVLLLKGFHARSIVVTGSSTISDTQ